MSIRALPSFKENRWRVSPDNNDLVRLVSILDAVKPELSEYKKRLSEQWKNDLAVSEDRSLNSSESLRVYACLESLFPALDELVVRSYSAEKRARILLTEEESFKIRVIDYCARRLPELKGSIAWSEFSEALAPFLSAIDQGAFEYFSAQYVPKAVTCTVDKLKRNRDAEPESSDNEDNAQEYIEETDGLDWNT